MKKGKRGLLIVLAVMMTVSWFPVQAIASSTLDKIKKEEEEKRKNEEELLKQQGSLGELQSTQTGLKGQLNNLTSELTNVSNRLSNLENAIADKYAEIQETEEDLKEAKEDERFQYEAMKKRIQFMYERGDTAYLEMVFAAKSFADFLNKTDYITQISEYDKKMLVEFQEMRAEIEETEKRLNAEKDELDTLKTEVEVEQGKVSSLVSQTANTVAKYGNEIAAVEEEVFKTEAEIQIQTNNIAELRKQYEAELALSRLAANSVWRDISQVTFAEGDRYLLANIIYCEAGNQPYEGQVAVGAVVINRVLSSRYPDTVVGVIYQKSQFSPVGSGRLALALAEDRATPACYQAADEAMGGRSNVENCLYFRTPIEGVSPRYAIAGHIFY